MAFDGTKATVWPVKSQAFEFTTTIVSSATANPVAVGTLTMTISKDGADGAAAAGSAASIGAMTGGVKVELTAADMAANVIYGQIASNTANAVTVCFEIKPVDLSETWVGHPLAQAVIKLERLIMGTHGYFYNRSKRAISTGTITVYHRDGTTAIGTMTRTQPTDAITKETLS